MSHTFEANGAVFDDFRAVTVGTTLSGRTSDSGHTWVQYNETWVVQDPVGADEGNAAGTSGIGSHARIGIDFGSADADVETTVEVWDGSANRGGLMLRRTASGFYTVSGGGGGGIEVYKVTNAGTQTLLASYGGGGLGDLTVIRAVCSGNDITVYRDGVEQGTVTDATYNGTVHGLYQRFAGADNAVRAYAFNMHPGTDSAKWAVDSVGW